MTIAVDCDNPTVEQVSKQLYRLIEVLKVSDVSEDPHVARELVLVKVHAPSTRRGEISSLAEVFGARIVDVGHDTLMVELTASPDKVDTFVELVRPFGIREIVRTGRVAMVRGTPSHAAETYVRVA